MKKMRIIVAALWLALAVFAWVRPADAVSESERRPLTQFPELTVKTIFDGSFMEKFEDYTLDQFPLRDAFRSFKANIQLKLFGQKDNNNIYVVDGYAAQLEYPYDAASIDRALSRFQYVYDNYLTDCNVFLTVVPDKGCYLAEENGYPAMDYEAMFADLQSGMPWAEFIDLTDTLSLDSYYRTDTHWRQEAILPAAEKIADALGVTVGEFTEKNLETPFYGVYCGQSALNLDPDEIRVLEADWMADCEVYDAESGSWGEIYDLPKLEGQDPYEVYLSGSRSLLTIENPNAATDRELIIFRDSFGSSVAPLLVKDYARVTLVDIRYMSPTILGNFIEFGGQDVLFLYSTLVLNNSETIK